MLFRISVLFFIVFTFLKSIQAQEIDKYCPEKDFNLRLNSEFFLQNGSFIFYESNWQIGHNQVYDKINSLPFYQMYHLIGYEIPFSGRWAGGIGMRHNYFNRLRISSIRGHLNHSSQIFDFVFFKEFSFERYWQTNNNQDYSQAGLRLMLGRDVKFKKKSFRPVFGYDLFKNFFEEDLAKNRRIHRTNLRLGVDYFFKKNLSLGVYYDKQTDYYFADEYYIEDEEGILTKIPERKLNIILPVWTVRLHWQWYKNEDDKKRLVF